MARVAGLLVIGYVRVRWVSPFLVPEQRDAVVRQWCLDMLRVLRIRLSIHGRPIESSDGALVIANHVSWVDTLAIRALMPCGFLAKASLQGWPVIGPLIERTGGLFVQRGNPFDLRRVLDDMREALKAGQSICVFPEGTTTDGTSVGSFTTLAFELTARHDVPVLPLGLQYLQHGRPSRVPAWVGDEAFLPSLFRIATTPGLEVRVVAGERLASSNERRRAADEARRAVGELLSVPLAPGPAAAAATTGSAPEDERAADLADTVRQWIAADRKLALHDVADHAPLCAFGVDSLSILDLLQDLEVRTGFRVDESRLDLSSRTTVPGLVAAMLRGEVRAAGEPPARATLPV